MFWRRVLPGFRQAMLNGFETNMAAVSARVDAAVP